MVPLPSPSQAPAAAFFDLDRTLISGSSAFTFGIAAWRADLLESGTLARDGLRALSFRLFGATDETSTATRDRILAAVAGADRAELLALNEHIIPRLLERVRPESRALIDMHHEAGRETWIVSASPMELVDPLAGAIGMTGGIGTRSAVVDGHYTGQLDGPFVYGEGKAEAIVRLAEEHGYDLRLSYAYSDSVSDLPMMEAVGHPVAVNPDRPLEQVARRRGWPIVIFAQRTKQVVGTSSAIGGAIALAGTTYALGRRQGRRDQA
jgi:HAD superfamily hydrolase (TIGR01490 family)